ncbi:MAG: RagB/SusD family nutrient uptake outer membrane protein [Carboxylicivirga sp.]|nr:RagB/SusD family nutrient uptake outer membrane protein [Carboxylicivirga sp.]
MDCIIVEDDIILTPVAPSPMVDVNAYAIDMAEQAVALLPKYSEWRTKDGASASRKDVACKGTANALFAELCLWQAGCKWFLKADDQNKINQQELWTKAEKACTDIISSTEYTLVGSAEEICEKIFKSNSTEAIYQLPIRGYTSEASFSTLAAFFTYSWPVRTDEQPANVMSKLFQLSSDFVKDMYEPEDERRNAFFYHLDDPTPEMLPFSSVAFPYKHRDAVIDLTPGSLYGSFLGLHSDYILYRLSQIYLFRAEARVRLNKDDLAIEDINEIRRRSNAPLYESSEFEGDVQMAVFKEADREFILEDERYPRIIRQGESYVREFLLGNFKTASISDFTDGAFFAPYDDGPFANNDLMRQNVYWSKRK